MLSQVNHWIEIIGTAIDALLLLRVLQLKLQRTYVFITLACVLSLFFDGVMLWLHSDSAEFGRIFIYSRFLYAFVYPAAAYDVWEEAKEHVARIRRSGIFRLVSSLIIAAILGLIITGFASGEEGADESLYATFGVILWAASTTASLAFLWSMHRLTRAQKIELPSNTAVWLLFYQLLLAGEVVACFLIILNQQFSPFVSTALDVSLGLYEIFITLWCVWKLRALPAGISPTREGTLTGQ